MQLLRLILAALVLVTTATTSPATESEKLEESVCGFFREPFAFWTWSIAAGTPNPATAGQVPNAEPMVHRTKDGRLLRGYKLRSTATDGAVIGSILVAQGNAMLADQLLSSLAGFSRAGLDVYIFDYRGYGGSEGNRRLKAMVSDYQELFARIGASAKGKRFLYGISFGGVVLLNVVGSGIDFDRAVIDSTPSRVSHLGCPEQYDPVVNFPKDGARFLLIAGEQDTVVPRQSSQDLLDVAETRGGRAIVRPDYAHPFMDSNADIHSERLDLIRAFFAGTEGLEAR
ncbi:MAG: alpha/beta fold hydrolase [Gammaproteobacteria bacterium]|nr:alpha/beta fold hydrolase [Gammaproteobacteria bacterium]